jgi:translation initiation factor IF-3
MKNKQQERPLRVNEQIRISPVRVVRDNNQLGVMPLDQAKRLAQQGGLDLVEIVPQARPPVCIIVDYGKYNYEKSIREKELKKKAKTHELKEIKLTPKIGEHDIQTKAKAGQRFLEEGKRVQITLELKGRELAHRDEGFKVVDRFLQILNGIAKIEYGPKFEGRSIVCKIEPKDE